ncbi:GapS1 family protein [Pseudomonas asiatica]|uniref:Uncharacterized protein n=1 Tax=Pseudomonas asiatica TaxID=2219225 RepID=A0ABU5L4A8_9PSED|nr:hypothetical protein [Pseudomonas asiatica]MDZ5740974.1 hypothetical protein [Pseudomonas asiatica]MDZ5746295.1 hypothetical protein [Pseudomonas asiatica]MDZ5751260.1 hypothetical protein [Pseudomonas asiatica]MDZ5756272.1 hypothetical protein [Pseudomonas asiatica]
MSEYCSQGTDFFQGLKEIQYEVRKYDPRSVLAGSLRYLHAPAKNKVEKLSRQPWLILLLIKWVFLDRLANGIFLRPAISDAELLPILQKVLDLSGKGYMPAEFSNVRLFMRSLAYQQFLFQKDDGLISLARQEVIFGRVQSNHYFKTEFEKGTGLSVTTFIRLSFALIATVESHGFSFSRPHLFALCPPYTPFEIDAFLRAVSIEVHSLHEFLMKADGGDTGPEDFLQQTPFLQKPLIKIGSIYCCVSNQVLQRSLGHFIYDRLKQSDVNAFNTPFGKAFERYVGSYLQETKLPLATEPELIKFLPGSGGVIDFLIADGESNVLIDAKGVEMSQRGMVCMTPGDVRRATKTSLMKAFEQGHEVVSRIPEGSTHPVIRRRTNNYLLVVTYKELYIGNGMALQDVVGVEALDRIREGYRKEFHIPVENMYFLTVHEFERLAVSVTRGEYGLAEAIERSKKADSNPYTQKFIYEMHLNEWKQTMGSEFPLLNVLHEMVERLDIATTRPRLE